MKFPPNDKGFLYAVERGQYIKIGFSIYPAGRIRQHLTTRFLPLNATAHGLIGAIGIRPAIRSEERVLHFRLAKILKLRRWRKEWYERNQVLLREVDALGLTPFDPYSQGAGWSRAEVRQRIERRLSA